ncbi:methyltransferase [Niastella vici]|uniref:Methyltransferase n=1 Tax=Niastella vici TaxID=1703345 RepID=A0A1V9G504_9BACT|nr:methyltransferase domain-containing protein [Niastella vici]OQP65721.1 methyltransferase [Niastella vici]
MPFVPTSRYLDHIFKSEQSFCQLFPESIQQLDKQHWSPLNIIYKAVTFLSNKKQARILDIGSGSGKFCLAGAYYNPLAFFYGVEQRQSLIEQAQSAKEKLGISNVEFIYRNFTQLDLKEFEGFYFYNSFFENLPGTDKIDDSIAYTSELYHYYSIYLNKQLDTMPPGTKVATYCSWDDEIPPGYQKVEAHANGLLKLWIKM